VSYLVDHLQPEGVSKGEGKALPFRFWWVLQEHADFDMMHRRGGGTRALQYGYLGRRAHADSHKYCPLGRCGTRPGPHSGGSQTNNKTQKIVTWRKAKALANRAYLEENVYGKTTRLV